MIATVQVDEVNFKRYLSLCPGEQVDVIFKGDVMIFVSNMATICACYSASVIRKDSVSQEDIGTSFRIPRGLMADMLDKGAIRFKVAESVVVEFINSKGKVMYNFEVEKQVIFTKPYQHKLDMCGIYADFAQVKFDNLGHIARIAKMFKTVVTIKDGVVHVDYNNSIVYTNVECGTPIAIQGVLLSSILAMGSAIYNVQDSLISTKGSMTLIVAKSKVLSYNDMDFIEAQEVESEYKLSLRDITALAKRCRITVGEMTIDLNYKKAHYKDENGVKFTASIGVELLEKEINLEELDLSSLDVLETNVGATNSFIVPDWIVRYILNISSVDTDDIRFCVYKNFILMKTNKFNIVFGRG